MTTADSAGRQSEFDVQHLPEDAIFNIEHTPLVVRKSRHFQPTGRGAVDAIKCVLMVAGRSRIVFSDGVWDARDGTVIIIPAGAWCSAVPIGFASCLTLHLRRDFVNAQEPWMSDGHPLRPFVGP